MVERSDLYKGGPVKELTEGLNKTGGRNNQGRITSRRMGGGHKRRYRFIDFRRNKFDVAATVERLEYDPNRTAFIALIKYEDGERSYILAPQRLQVGDSIISGEKVDIKPGNAMPLKNMPVGTVVHNIELNPGRGGQVARSAGCYAQLIGKDAGYAQLRLNSGELRLVRGECLASVGAVSMNPVDHPLGGGEGRSSGGRHPVTPWGKCTKGKKTRTNKKTNVFIMRSRHASKKKA